MFGFLCGVGDVLGVSEFCVKCQSKYFRCVCGWKWSVVDVEVDLVAVLGRIRSEKCCCCFGGIE